MTAPVRRSPISRHHADLGAATQTEAGWELVSGYGDEAAELAFLAGSVGVVDVTPRGKIDVHGPTDGALSVAGDALVADVTDGWALVLTEPGGEEVLLPKMTSAAGDSAMVTDATHLFAGLALAGPGVAEAMSLLTSFDQASLRPGRSAGAPIGGVRSVLVRRELEMPVLEFYVGSESGRYIWETVLDAVRRVGGGPVGWRALRERGWS